MGNKNQSKTVEGLLSEKKYSALISLPITTIFRSEVKAFPSQISPFLFAVNHTSLTVYQTHDRFTIYLIVAYKHAAVERTNGGLDNACIYVFKRIYK